MHGWLASAQFSRSTSIGFPLRRKPSRYVTRYGPVPSTGGERTLLLCRRCASRQRPSPVTKAEVSVRRADNRGETNEGARIRGQQTSRGSNVRPRLVQRRPLVRVSDCARNVRAWSVFALILVGGDRLLLDLSVAVGVEHSEPGAGRGRGGSVC